MKRVLFFWLDRWVGDVHLSDRFHHLYDLSEYKSIIVAEMFARGWDEGGDAWKWRRRLWVWEEEMLEECHNLLLTIVLLQVDLDDVWMWAHDPVVGYTVGGAHRILTDRALHIDYVHAALLWRKDIPLKVLVFAWFLLQTMSSLVPLHFQGISLDYNCSRTLARNFQMLKHTNKRLPMLNHNWNRVPMLKHADKRLLKVFK